jgi:hypothetical protein
MIQISVFWLDRNLDPRFEYFSSAFDKDPMRFALNCMENLRRSGEQFVCMSAQNSDSVGEVGVDSIINGKTPDGQDYDWKKRRE